MAFKILKIGFVILTMIVGVWYLIIKDYDYKITFKTPQASGVVYNYLLGWNNWQSSNNKIVTASNKIPFSKLRQDFIVSDTNVNIEWKIVRESNSVTKVTAYLKDKNNSLIQKLKVPFIKTDFVKRSLSTVTRIQRELAELEKSYIVGNIETSKIPKQFCAYISLESKLSEKANQMMAGNYYIINYFKENNIDIKGSPFLEVTSWNEKDNSLKFNFCFPITFSDNYKESKGVKFKMTEEKSALKTTFNGNYRISDCAWFSIIDYAEQRKINIEKLPIEIFKNDPHSGGNELEWVAEIYIPVKNN